MLKRTSVLLFMLTLSQFAFSQKPVSIYYLKGYEILPNISGADYILTFYPSDSAVDKNLFVVKEYYSDGNLRFESRSKTTKLKALDKASDFGEPVLEAGYVEYFRSGKKKTMKSFEDGKPVGAEMDFYPNGKLYRVKTYVSDNKSVYNECRDSTGKVIVENGVGTGVNFLQQDNFKDYLSGQVINGLEEGKWTGKIDDTVNVVATYKNGELKTYATADTTSDQVYFKPEKNPEFPGGFEAFYKYLAHNVHYPPEDRDNHRQGRVVVGFIIDEKGKLTHIAIEKSISTTIDAEAIRVMKNCPAWTPGLVNNKPVKVKYTVPIGFTLSVAN